MNTRFDRKTLEGLPNTDRRQRLDALAEMLSARLSPYLEWAGYWREVQSVIDDLRTLGHDLWRHDWDGESRELWGWDYMKKEGAGQLQLQFRFRGEVKTFWRSENPMLGVETDDE